jgi:ABC-2 type transport system ATP-binding protein
VLTVDRLTKKFGRIVAADDISFSVEEGSITALLGENGSGKTTVLRALLGLVRPTSGAATIFGRPYAKLETPACTVGVVLERPPFDPRRTGLVSLRIRAAVLGIDDRRCDEVLRRVGIAPDDAKRRVRTYSLGMQQRLAVAAALLGEPRVLIFDEPTNGLDPDAILWLRETVRDLADGGKSVLFSTHAVHEADLISDAVVILRRGRVIASGPLGDVAGQPTVVAGSDDTGRLLAALTSAGFACHAENKGRVAVEVSDPRAVAAVAAREQIDVHELFVRVGNLEQAYFAAVAGART